MVGTEASVVRHRLLPVGIYWQTFQEHQPTGANSVLPGLLQRQTRRLATNGCDTDNGVCTLTECQQVQRGERTA